MSGGTIVLTPESKDISETPDICYPHLEVHSLLFQPQRSSGLIATKSSCGAGPSVSISSEFLEHVTRGNTSYPNWVRPCALNIKHSLHIPAVFAAQSACGAGAVDAARYTVRTEGVGFIK